MANQIPEAYSKPDEQVLIELLIETRRDLEQTRRTAQQFQQQIQTLQKQLEEKADDGSKADETEDLQDL